jgi:hypothetical protein
VHALEYVKLGTGGQGQKGGLSAYAEQIGKSHSYVVHVRQAAEVLKTLQSVSWGTGLLDKAKHLAAIHSAPQDTWSLLVEEILTGEWSKEDTEKAVNRVKDLLAAIPAWRTVDRPSVLERDEPDADTCVTLDALLRR